MIGSTVSHYRVLEHLGGGGMGVVYKAHDTVLGRTVALKFLHSEWSRDPDSRERFLREARAAAALEHPRVCPVYEIGETDDGQLFIAMAFYEGETLKPRIGRGRLPIAEAVGIAVQTAEGLAHAHAAGVVHRDIKPANLMITNSGEVKILDFGLAKMAGDASLTRTGSTLGTPFYMAPEQASGGEVDGRADLWAVGAVLYEMVTGQRPFNGENELAVLRAISHDSPRPLTELRREAPLGLERIVGHALKKDPSRRVSDARRLLADLRSLESEFEPGEDATATLPEAPKRRRHARRGPLSALAAVVLVAVMLVWILGQGEVEEPVAAQTRIVVLPFENLGPPEDAYFADGMTEEITARLATIGALGVIGRTSAMQYRSTDKSISVIGAELAVDYVLEGTIRWHRLSDGSSRIRVTPQLVRVADETHAWAQIYERDLSDIFEVQSDIARQVVSALGGALAVQPSVEAEDPPTTNIEAYDFYLRGIYHWDVRDSVEDYQQAVAWLERAVELDPDFARAHAALAQVLSVLYSGRGYAERDDRRLDQAWAAASRAVELEPGLSEGHVALGLYSAWASGDDESALKEYARALEADPNNVNAILYQAAILSRRGRADPTLQYERAFRLSPRDPAISVSLAAAYRNAGRFDEALQMYDLTIALQPDSVVPYYAKALLLTRWLGDTARARAVLEQARAHAVLEQIRATGVVDESVVALEIYLDTLDRRYDEASSRLADIRSEAFLDHYSRDLPTSLLAAQVASFAGDDEAARESYQEAVTLLEARLREGPDSWRTRRPLAIAYAGLGRRDEAVREARAAVASTAETRPGLALTYAKSDLALVYAMVGEDDSAIDILTELTRISYSPVMPAVLRIDPQWDSLRDHPRFRELLEQS